MRITWAIDVTDGVFDKSDIIDIDNKFDKWKLDSDEFEINEEPFELTREGAELYAEWSDDMSLGYDLCSGKCKGLAEKYSRREMYVTLRDSPQYNVDFDLEKYPRKYNVIGQEKNIRSGIELTFHRIVAARDIYGPAGELRAKKGDLGGLMDRPDALSHRGSCWLGKDAMIGGGYVKDDALVAEHAYVGEDCVVSKNASMKGDSSIDFNVTLTDEAKMAGEAQASSYSELYNDTELEGTVTVIGCALYGGKYTEGEIYEENNYGYGR